MRFAHAVTVTAALLASAALAAPGERGVGYTPEVVETDAPPAPRAAAPDRAQFRVDRAEGRADRAIAPGSDAARNDGRRFDDARRADRADRGEAGALRGRSDFEGRRAQYEAGRASRDADQARRAGEIDGRRAQYDAARANFDAERARADGVRGQEEARRRLAEAQLRGGSPRPDWNRDGRADGIVDRRDGFRDRDRDGRPDWRDGRDNRFDTYPGARLVYRDPRWTWGYGGAWSSGRWGYDPRFGNDPRHDQWWDRDFGYGSSYGYGSGYGSGYGNDRYGVRADELVRRDRILERWALSFFDRDRDGYLDRDERFRAARALLLLADFNGDGRIGDRELRYARAEAYRYAY